MRSIFPEHDRFPRLHPTTLSVIIIGKTGFQPVPANRLPACFFACHLRRTGVLACLSRSAVVPANRLPACFFTCHLRKTGFQPVSSLPIRFERQTTAPHIMITASIAASNSLGKTHTQDRYGSAFTTV
jgi:hypothetical protein